MTHPHTDFLFAYQPVLDRQRNSVALALLYQEQDGELVSMGDHATAMAQVVVNAYVNSEIAELLGKRKVFIKIDPFFLSSSMVSILPASKVVLLLVNSGEVSPELVNQCQEIKRMGYTLALDGFVPSESSHLLLEHIDIVKLDIQLLPRAKLKVIAGMLRGPSITLLADKVESQAEFDGCCKLGFELFQGYFFARPTVLIGRHPDPRQIAILNLLSLVNRDANDAELEDAFKLNPDLTLHLLRLLNSAAFALAEKVSTLRQAISLFGRDKLAKWLQILLFTAGENGGNDWPLFEMAAKRGRVIELLVQDVTHRTNSLMQDQGFMVGMLSLVDVLFNAEMKDILLQIGIAEELQNAIMTHSGTLGSLLLLCEKLELADFDAVSEISQTLNIPLERIMEVQKVATRWISEMP